jgi:hypothetical protein
MKTENRIFSQVYSYLGLAEKVRGQQEKDN